MRSACGVIALSAGLVACSGSSAPIGVTPAATARLAAARPGASTYKTLLVFNGGNGSDPVATLLALNGTLYGTTYAGGKWNAGTAFSISPSGKQTILHSFGWSYDAAWPFGGLTAVDGTLYGTTYKGGHPNGGAIFSLTTSGRERVLHQFGIKSGDGIDPTSTLLALNGVLYGTTFKGGANKAGTVFAFPVTGKRESFLYSFGGSGDGARPYAGLTAVGGELYGTTSAGGAHGKGTVFSLSRDGKERIVYSFAGGSDGANPESAVLAVGKTLYGTTNAGGAHARGTIYSVTTAGKERVLHSFGAPGDGAFPFAGLRLDKNTFYGTTTKGGKYAGGVVFSATPSGSETVLYSLGAGRDGSVPYAGLTALGSSLYGATAGGGSDRIGTIYQLTP